MSPFVEFASMSVAIALSPKPVSSKSLARLLQESEASGYLAAPVVRSAPELSAPPVVGAKPGRSEPVSSSLASSVPVSCRPAETAAAAEGLVVRDAPAVDGLAALCEPAAFFGPEGAPEPVPVPEQPTSARDRDSARHERAAL